MNNQFVWMSYKATGHNSLFGFSSFLSGQKNWFWAEISIVWTYPGTAAGNKLLAKSGTEHLFLLYESLFITEHVQNVLLLVTIIKLLKMCFVCLWSWTRWFYGAAVQVVLSTAPSLHVSESMSLMAKCLINSSAGSTVVFASSVEHTFVVYKWYSNPYLLSADIFLFISSVTSFSHAVNINIGHLYFKWTISNYSPAEVLLAQFSQLPDVCVLCTQTTKWDNDWW